MIIFLYFFGKDKNSRVDYISIEWKLYLVNRFKINVLVNNNIFGSKQFWINIIRKSIFIASYKVYLDINIK